LERFLEFIQQKAGKEWKGELEEIDFSVSAEDLIEEDIFDELLPL